MKHLVIMLELMTFSGRKKKWLNNILAHGFPSCGLLTLALVLTSGTASAETITRSFEIGAGTPQPASHFRTFTLPCRTRITASVTYSRAGAAGTENDVPIFIELREPGATANSDGAVLAVKEGLRATRTPKTSSLTTVVSDRSGCSIPWRVRVKHDASGAAPVSVTGNITINFTRTTFGINVAGGPFSLNRGQSTTKNVGDSQGIGNGTLVITGTWNHSILGATGPNPVRLKFELFDYAGRSLAVLEGYASNETRDLFKLKISGSIPECNPGQWKIKVTNVDNHDDAKDIDILVHYTPSCP